MAWTPPLEELEVPELLEPTPDEELLLDELELDELLEPVPELLLEDELDEELELLDDEVELPPLPPPPPSPPQAVARPQIATATKRLRVPLIMLAMFMAYLLARDAGLRLKHYKTKD